MRNIFIFTLIAAILTISLTGCGSHTSAQQELEATKAEAAETAKKLSEQRQATAMAAAQASENERRAIQAETAAHNASTMISYGLVGLTLIGLGLVFVVGLGYRLVKSAPVHPTIENAANRFNRTVQAVQQAQAQQTQAQTQQAQAQTQQAQAQQAPVVEQDLVELTPVVEQAPIVTGFERAAAAKHVPMSFELARAVQSATATTSPAPTQSI